MLQSFQGLICYGHVPSVAGGQKAHLAPPTPAAARWSKILHTHLQLCRKAVKRLASNPSDKPGVRIPLLQIPGFNRLFFIQSMFHVEFKMESMEGTTINTRQIPFYQVIERGGCWALFLLLSIIPLAVMSVLVVFAKLPHA
jgi:hypothetical protein